MHGSREAVVDGDLRPTYEQFGERCDRWSEALAKLGVKAGDRVVIRPDLYEQLNPVYAALLAPTTD